jgi:NADPH:quinone reductase-like Zn-dependent oxidoreductase
MPGADLTEGATMRAVGINRFGGPEELTCMTVPRPAPLPTEVLVRVHAAGVNPLDWRTRAGLPTPAAAALGAPPHILGWDVSGTVAETGADEFLFAPGDEVFGLLWLPRPAGAYAEFVTATAGSAKHGWLRTLGATEVIDYRVTPFEQVAQAHAHAENSATGKTVLHIAV